MWPEDLWNFFRGITPKTHDKDLVWYSGSKTFPMLYGMLGHGATGETIDSFNVRLHAVQTRFDPEYNILMPCPSNLLGVEQNPLKIALQNQVIVCTTWGNKALRNLVHILLGLEL
jgi:hypothetical protein